MKTVPTLCATATVVGASAVGLSFGREEAPLPPSNKRKATPARELDHRSMSAAVQTSTATTPLVSLSSPIPHSSSHRSFASRYSYDGRPPRSAIRRATSADTSLKRHSIMVTGNAPHSDHEAADDVESAEHLSARRPSWIKRLSQISTSQPSSRNSSPGPLSPSVSCSNGSMAFSHDGSTAPIIGKRSPSPLPPNKLVKRSSSVRVSHDTPSHGSGSRLPSLRRPATSHQRSATFHYQSALMEMAAEDHSGDDLPLPPKSDSGVQYTQFFTAKVSKEKTLSKRRSSAANARSFKRVFPDDKHRPTLVLARSVSAASDEVDELSSEDGDSVFFVSRPGTPMSLTAVIATEDHATRNGPATDEEAARPRRSFSISDFLSPGSRTKKVRTAKAPAKLVRKPSHRVSSAPVLPTMGSRQSNTAHGEHTGTSARRDLTDPTIVRREVSTSSGPTPSGNSRNGLHGNASSSPLPALPPHRALAQAERTPASMHQSDTRPGVSASANNIPPSPILAQAGGRPSRHSVAPSEQASTLVGSDNEARGIGSGEDDDADLQSETMFDSLRTGATRSTSGARGPRIETIFDESPPSKVKVTALRDLLPKGTFREHDVPGQQSIAEEEESISTPVRTIVPERSVTNSPSLSRGNSGPLFPSLIPSSPPDVPKPLSLGTLEWDSRAEEDDSSRWSVEDEEEGNSWGDFPTLPPATLISTPVSLQWPMTNGSSPKPSTPQHLPIDHADRDARSSIFDWSEQQPTDKSSGNRTPPRPRTVHGKKDADRRGSRPVGRASSGLHARSQSVPVVPDATGKRSTVVTNKFGTWGVGSKGVTEDWNDDFDFSEIHEEPAAEEAAQGHRVDSGTVIIVPKKIQEQQTNVLANIGLLREWGLLIEELKEHRTRAIDLGLLDGRHAEMWEEVEGMIALADQEAEHEGIPRLSPPSSPGFDEKAFFDDVAGPSPHHGQEKDTPGGLASEELSKNNSHPVPHASGRPRRRSILPSHQGIFAPQSSPIPSKPAFGTPKAPSDSKPIVTRPRKDSEAMAQTVIEALQKRKSVQESVAELERTAPTKKVPFDTATLRRIVPYVNTLTRRVKDALREAEGLHSSPNMSPREPPFSKIFHTDNDMTTQMKVMTIM